MITARRHAGRRQEAARRGGARFDCHLSVTYRAALMARRLSVNGRNRAQTERGILDAVGRILAHHGFGDIGINAIAREAGVDKVLVYRYFGGLPELLAAFAERTEFWPRADELLREAARAQGAGAAAAALKGLLRSLRARPLTLEVLRWELSSSNELIAQLVETRERQGVEVLQKIRAELGDDPRIDAPAIAAILSAGLTYLVLRSSVGSAWLGVPLKGEAGWKRIEAAIDLIVARVVAGSGRRAVRARPARRRKP